MLAFNDEGHDRGEAVEPGGHAVEEAGQRVRERLRPVMVLRKQNNSDLQTDFTARLHGCELSPRAITAGPFARCASKHDSASENR